MSAPVGQRGEIAQSFGVTVDARGSHPADDLAQEDIFVSVRQGVESRGCRFLPARPDLSNRFADEQAIVSGMCFKRRCNGGDYVVELASAEFVVNRFDLAEKFLAAD